MRGSTGLSTCYALSFPRAAAAIVGLAFAVLSPAPAAVAAPEGTLDGISLVLGTQGIFAAVHVESGDGKTWTAIKSENLTLGGPIKVEMKTGRIKAIGIFLGDCGGHQCVEGVAYPLLGSAHFGKWNDAFNTTVFPPLVEGQTSFPFQTAKLGVSTTGVAVPGFGDAIIAKCNAALKDGGSIHKGHSFTHTVPMTLGADTRSVQIYNFGTLTDNIVLGNEPLEDVDFNKTINVDLPVVCEPVSETPGAGAPGQVGTQLPEHKLLGATLHGDPAQYAGACPADIKLFMSATSNLPGAFTARVEAKSGWVSTPFHSQTSESDPSGTWSKHFLESMTVPVVYAIKPSDGGAKDAAKGIGNVKANPKSEEPILPGKGIPKMGEVKAGYNPGNLHEDSLRLVVKSGNQTVTTDWWKYSVTCDPNKAKVADDAPSGVKQSVFGKGAGATAQPDKQIVPSVVCLGGTVRGGRCTCAAGKTPKLGQYAISGNFASGWRCEDDAPPREIAKPVKPQPKLVCTGGSVRNDACACQAGFAPVKTGATSFRCQRVAIVPPLTIPKAVAPTRTLAPAIACAGGVVRSNRCVCPAGMSLQSGVCRVASRAPVRSGATPLRVR